MRARLPAKLGAAVCLLLCAWFLAPLGMGIVHIGMLWPSALLVLAAARLLRRENRRKSYVAAGRQNPGWAAAVPGWQRDSFLRFSQIPRMRDGVCWRMIA